MDMQTLAYIFFVSLLAVAALIGMRLQKHEDKRIEK